jgi:hypothetical protein
MNTQKKQKYFVNRKEEVTIRCRTCGRTETFPVASFRGSKHSMRVNCACSQSFEVALEFRQDYRQKANISGSYRALTTPKTRARQCVIADHSNGGLLLAITDDVPVKKDDRLIVCYRPDVDSPHEIERIITVRHYARGSRIGGAFIDAPPPQQTAAPILH